MIRLRPMTAADIPLGMRLKDQAGWNQTEADWQRFLHLGDAGCFVAECDGQAVATASTCIFGPIGWIAMVLVDPEYRHRGIATRLVEQALDYFDRQGVASARLDATKLGRPVYERLGFAAEYELLRMEGFAPAGPSAAVSARCAAAGPEQLDAIAALDESATGTSRRRLLSELLTEPAQRSWTVGTADSPQGYLISRPGARAVQLGPSAAVSPNAGLQLLDQGLQAWAGSRVYVDLPGGNSPALEWAGQRGLTAQRPFIRMVRGRPIADRPDQLWASSGPEKG